MHLGLPIPDDITAQTPKRKKRVWDLGMNKIKLNQPRQALVPSQGPMGKRLVDIVILVWGSMDILGRVQN